MISRREVLRGLGVGVVAVPLMGVSAVVALGRSKPEPIPPFFNGGVLSAAAMNALVDRVNELSERAS